MFKGFYDGSAVAVKRLKVCSLNSVSFGFGRIVGSDE